MTKRVDVFADKLVGVDDLVRLFGCCRRTVYRRIETGTLPPPVKLGNRLHWRESDILAVLGNEGEATVRA